MDTEHPLWVTPAAARAAAEGRYGALVRAARAALGLTLEQAGARCGYSASWLSRMETGRTRLTNTTHLRALSEALSIPVNLFGLAPHPSRAATAQSAPIGVTVADHSQARQDGDDPVRRRQLLTGIAGLTSGMVLDSATGAAGSGDRIAGPLTDALLDPAPALPDPVNSRTVQAAVAAARADHQACRYRELASRLPQLIRDATALREQASAGHLCTAEATLAEAYGLATHLAIKLHDDGLAWISLDRALRAARACGDPLIEADTHRWAAVVLRRSAHKAKAQTVVLDAADRLATQTGLTPGEHASAFAALRATAAYTAAIQDDRGTAMDLIDEAAQACRRFGGGTTSYRQVFAFGPIDIAIYKIGIARKLGDFGAAVGHARAVRPEQIINPERRVRYWEDTALALHGRGRPADAFRALLAAESLAPQEVCHRPWAQDLTIGLLAADRRNTLPGLRQLADKILPSG